MDMETDGYVLLVSFSLNDIDNGSRRTHTRPLGLWHHHLRRPLESLMNEICTRLLQNLVKGTNFWDLRIV